MFTQQIPDQTISQIPYRVRYKASFEGSQSELETAILDCLEKLDATLIDVEEPIRHNPIENRYELAAILNKDLEFSLLIYWANNGQIPISITFDLDSPVAIEIPVNDQFLNLAKPYFPTMKIVYSFLNRPKVIIRKSKNPQDTLKNHQWIKEHRQEYRGRWVSLKAGELLADGASSHELLQRVKPNETTLLTVVY